MSRTTIATYGTRGRSVRVFRERHLVRVQWRRQGLLKTESFPATPAGTREAREFAKGVAKQLAGGHVPATLTVRDLWLRYCEAEFPHLRPRTCALTAEGWRRWELFVGAHTPAEDHGVATLAAFRATLDKQFAVSTVQRSIRSVRVVYNWGEAHELMRSRLHGYRFKVAKDKRPAPVAEYRTEDFLKLKAALPLDSSRTWRAGVVVRLCGALGARQRAVRHLTPADCDLDGNRIHWAAEFDKLGREEWQTLRRDAREAIEAALRWRETLGYRGRWLIPAQRVDQPYSAQSLWWSLTAAEQRAKIPHVRKRGAHGLRRMLAGNVLAETGNPRMAARAIRDRDLRVMDRYLLDRDDQMGEVFEALDAAEARMASETETVTETVTGSGGAE
jgi:site-specific recombinase XerD